jgi:transcriptional regulator with XRE-family HTH domain
MKKESPQNLIRSFIKRQLEHRDLTYKELARAMNVSEITVKRWLTKRDFSTATLIEFGKILDFNVFDFIEANYFAPIHHQSYSIQQEEFLVKEPKAGLLLLKLIYNYPPEEIRQMLQISQAEFLRLLRKLDNLKFLELHPGEKIRFIMKGPFRAREEGPYLQKYAPRLRDLIFSYFKQNYQTFKERSDLKNFEISRPFEMYMSRESAVKFGHELVQLIAKYRQLTVLESKTGDKMIPVSGFVGLADYDSWKDAYLK